MKRKKEERGMGGGKIKKEKWREKGREEEKRRRDEEMNFAKTEEVVLINCSQVGRVASPVETIFLRNVP